MKVMLVLFREKLDLPGNPVAESLNAKSHDMALIPQARMLRVVAVARAGAPAPKARYIPLEAVASMELEDELAPVKGKQSP